MTKSLTYSLLLDDHSNNQTTPMERAWLRRCLPIIVQPHVDLVHGNELLQVFFHFERDGRTGRLDCQLCLVYAGEASYNRVWEKQENGLATLMYRTFNRKTYHRTADIKHVEYRGVDLSPESPRPWESIYSIDNSVSQRWAQGDKANIGCWFSLMRHYTQDIGYDTWRREEHRPFIYLNTSNHMMMEQDTNPHLSKHEWRDYGIQAGDAEDALHYAVEHVPTKCNLYSLVCCFNARNGGRIADGLLQNCGRRRRQEISRSIDLEQKTPSTPAVSM